MHGAAAYICDRVRRKRITECVDPAIGTDDVSSHAALRMFVFCAGWPFPYIVNRNCPVPIADWLWLELKYVIVRHVEQKVHVLFTGVPRVGPWRCATGNEKDQQCS